MTKQLTQEKWEELVNLYGDKAYLMCCIIDESCNFDSNNQVQIAIEEHPEVLIFKQSAALPFDLAAAKVGDVVECKIYTGKWLKLKSFELCEYPAQTPCVLYGH